MAYEKPSVFFQGQALADMTRVSVKFREEFPAVSPENALEIICGVFIGAMGTDTELERDYAFGRIMDDYGEGLPDTAPLRAKALIETIAIGNPGNLN